MKDTWRGIFRRLAAGCVIAGSTAWTSAVCYAVQLANDTASDPVYASGWSAGQNGGTGFGAWNFESGYFWLYNQQFYPYNQDVHAIDNGTKSGTQFSNPFNDIGRAWALANISYTKDNGQPGITLPRAGRSLPPLQPGQTLSFVIDNPTERKYFGGYIIHLNGNSQAINGATGQHGNICYGNRPCYYIPNPANPSTSIKGADPKEQVRFQIFNFTNCYSGICTPSDPRAQWTIDGLGPSVTSSITDTASAAGGLRIDFTLTAADSYTATLTPLGNPGAAFTTSGDIAVPGTNIDWFQIESFNGKVSDTGSPPTTATDLYLRSITISDSTPGGVPGDYNGNGTVDAADYVLWRNGGPLQNEVDNPGTVNAADYTAWRARFANTSGSGTVMIGGSAVPEPGIFVFLAAGAVGVVGLSNRRRS